MDNGYDSPTGIARLEISDENMIPTNSALIHVESISIYPLCSGRSR